MDICYIILNNFQSLSNRCNTSYLYIFIYVNMCVYVFNVQNVQIYNGFKNYPETE